MSPLRISTTVPTHDPRQVAAHLADIERIGYDGAFTFEARHDPFLPLATACASTSNLRLGTAIAIAFARNPMVLANIGYDLQLLSEGRFVLGLGSQIKPHIEKRYSETWSRPAARMAEMVRAIRAIWSAWQGEGPLRFEGDFYRHTLMTPAFDPGPNPFGPPPIMIGAFGERMLGVTGEVADGLIVHPFNSRRTMEELTLPALDRGVERAGRSRAEIEVVWVTMVVTWTNEAERETAMRSAKGQFSFYGSTPAYRPTLDLHGWGDLHPELNALSKHGEWDRMADLIPDELVETIAVCGPRDEIAARVLDRVTGITDHVGLVNSRNPDPQHFADIVTALRTR